MTDYCHFVIQFHSITKGSTQFGKMNAILQDGFDPINYTNFIKIFSIGLMEFIYHF